jgi:hypothetical protein
MLVCCLLEEGSSSCILERYQFFPLSIGEQLPQLALMIVDQARQGPTSPILL